MGCRSGDFGGKSDRFGEVEGSRLKVGVKDASQVLARAPGLGDGDSD